MSRSAFSAKVFAIYLFVLGSTLIAAPNLLLSVFGIPPTTEVWIHVIGVLVAVIGVYAWIGARHENRPFLEASVITRCLVCVALAGFAAFGMASPMLALFGLVDLAGAMWTWFALKADAQAAKPALARLG